MDPQGLHFQEPESPGYNLASELVELPDLEPLVNPLQICHVDNILKAHDTTANSLETDSLSLLTRLQLLKSDLCLICNTLKRQETNTNNLISSWKSKISG